MTSIDMLGAFSTVRKPEYYDFSAHVGKLVFENLPVPDVGYSIPTSSRVRGPPANQCI